MVTETELLVVAIPHNMVRCYYTKWHDSDQGVAGGSAGGNGGGGGGGHTDMASTNTNNSSGDSNPKEDLIILENLYPQVSHNKTIGRTIKFRKMFGLVAGKHFVYNLKERVSI